MSNIVYHLHTDLNLIEVHPSGVVQASDIVSYAQEALSLDIVTEGTIECHDLSELSHFKGDYESAYGLTGLLLEWISRGWQGSVFFAPRDHQFGMIRMTGAILENIQDTPAVVMVPRREPTALRAYPKTPAARKVIQAQARCRKAS
jgi:hypothetical protein